MKLFGRKDKKDKEDKHNSKGDKKSKKSSHAAPAAPDVAGAGGESVASSADAAAPVYAAPTREELLQQHGMHGETLTLESFRLVRTVGTGSFGRVVVSEYLKTGRYYAIKAQNKADIVRLKQVSHVRDEKAILAQLSHPNVVNLLAWFQDNARLYLVLEFVSGGEMFTFLRRAQRFDEERTRFYAAQIVSAFGYLHERHIVYRDLKPENLLFDDKGNVKVTDFGFAKIVEERTYTVCGTPEYIAPEIIRSQGHATSADWWALGVLIYEMIAGYPPFFADSPLGIYEKILSDKPVAFAKYFSKDARDLIRKLLQHDITKRLGCMKGGVDDIKAHRFFAPIKWSALDAGVTSPAWSPPTRPAGDASNFDKYKEIDLTKGSNVDPKKFGDKFADWDD